MANEFDKRAVKKGSLNFRKEVVAEDELSEAHRITAKIETDSQLKEAFAVMESYSFWAEIEKLASECDRLLAENGLPQVGQYVCVEDSGDWYPFDPKVKLKSGQRIRVESGAEYVQKAHRDLSDVWYAAKIGRKCREALHHQSKSDGGTDYLFSFVFEIATLRTDWSWRSSRKKPLITGLKQCRNLREKRDMQNRKTRQEAASRRAIVEKLMAETRLTGGGLDRWLQHRLLRDYGLSVSPRTLREDRRSINHR